MVESSQASPIVTIDSTSSLSERDHEAGLEQRRGRRGALVTGGCVAIYAVLGVLANLPVWLDGASHVVQCGACGDIGQEVWFLAWQQFAVAHGHTGLLTSAINIPTGANLMDNTAMPLAGLVGAPITAIFGPVATYNVLFSLAFAGSATAAFFVLRRWVSWTPAAFVGGLMFGFSPYMIGQGLGHLFLLLVMLIPVMLLCLDEIFVRQKARPALVGAAFGVVGAAQLGLSSEILAWAAIVAVLGAILLALANREKVRSHAAYAARALGVSAAVFVVIGAYPLWVMLAGPAHFTRLDHPLTSVSTLSTDVASPVVPTSNQMLTAGLASRGDSYVVYTTPATPTTPARPSPDPAEDGSYIGVPLLLLLIGGAWVHRRDRTLRFALSMAAVALVLSAGSTLHFLGHSLRVPLPFAVFLHFPLLNRLIASRASLIMWLFIAMALAVLLDRSVRKRPRHGPSSPYRPLRLLGVTAVALVPLLPAWPYQMSAVQLPRYFSTSGPASRLGSRKVLLAYPFPNGPNDEAMLWQALDGYSYRIVGGYAFAPDTPTSTISYTESLFDSCYAGQPAVRISQTLRVAVRTNLMSWSVSTIVIPDDQPNAGCAVSEIRAVLGIPPQHVARASVWRSVGSYLRHAAG